MAKQEKKISWREEMVQHAHRRLGNTIGKARLRYYISLLTTAELKFVLEDADKAEARRKGSWSKGFWDAMKASGRLGDKQIAFEGRGV